MLVLQIVTCSPIWVPSLTFSSASRDCTQRISSWKYSHDLVFGKTLPKSYGCLDSVQWLQKLHIFKMKYNQNSIWNLYSPCKYTATYCRKIYLKLKISTLLHLHHWPIVGEPHFSPEKLMVKTMVTIVMMMLVYGVFLEKFLSCYSGQYCQKSG